MSVLTSVTKFLTLQIWSRRFNYLRYKSTGTLSSSIYEKSLQRHKTLLWIKNDLGITSTCRLSKSFDNNRRKQNLIVYDRSD